MKKWHEIKAAAAGRAELWIYEEIGQTSLWEEGLTAKNLVRDINALDVAQIDLHINSPGGSVFDGQAIYNALVRHPANVTTYIDGLAGSIASVVALAGTAIVMPTNAMMMIHQPWGMAVGYAADMRHMADALEKVGETILNVYDEHSTKSRDELQAAMDAETWLTAEDALEYGFIAEVAEPVKIAAHFDLSRFRNAPMNTPAGPAEGPAQTVAETVEPPRRDWVPCPALGRIVPLSPRTP